MTELDKRQLMRIVVSEALRDRWLDADDKQKIGALALALGVTREEIEGQIRSLGALSSGESLGVEFDSLSVFQGACEAAAADRIFTKQEEELLFALKEVLGLPDELDPRRKGTFSAGQAHWRHARSRSTLMFHCKTSKTPGLFGEGLAIFGHCGKKSFGVSE